MSKNYNLTVIACFIAYVVQAIVNNFAPLLFLTFNSSYDIELSKITFLVTLNFFLQLLIDLLSVYFVDKIGYKKSLIIAHFVSFLGLFLLAILPNIINPYIGILISVIFYAIGGGLIEVIISPVVNACPSDNKQKAMSLLHSFYCWGHVGVVLLSTLFFLIFGINNWSILAIIWSLVPLANLFFFLNVPIPSILPEGKEGMELKDLIKIKVFWVLMLLMILAGACEQAVSQWASTFAELGLGVSKTIGDLCGPMLFAMMMGTSRLIYGKFGDKLPLKPSMFISGILCLISYILLGFNHNPIIGLLSLGLCGFSVGLLWPGTFSLASESLPNGGTALFAMLALGGDVGCSGGPTYVGLFSDVSLANGIAHAIIFPVLLLIGLYIIAKDGKHE